MAGGVLAALSPSSALTAAACTPSNPDLLISPAWVADLELGAEVGEHLHFALGANNWFDKYPNILPARRASFAPALP